jgi:hypothetical protein
MNIGQRIFVSDLTDAEEQISENLFRSKYSTETAKSFLKPCHDALTERMACSGKSITFLPSCIGFLDYLNTTWDNTNNEVNSIKYFEWCELLMVLLLFSISSDKKEIQFPGLVHKMTDLKFDKRSRHDMHVAIQNVSINTMGVTINGDWLFNAYYYCVENFISIIEKTKSMDHPGFEFYLAHMKNSSLDLHMFKERCTL